MNEQEEMRRTNSLKSKLEAGDLVYSKTYGVGFIHDIEPDDCWYPIEVKFEQKIWLFGKMETKYRHYLYNTEGQTNSVDLNSDDIDAWFYKVVK